MKNCNKKLIKSQYHILSSFTKPTGEKRTETLLYAQEVFNRMSANTSASPTAGVGGATVPLRQSARKRTTAVVMRNALETERNVTETTDDLRVLREKNIHRETAHVAAEADGNLSQGKDSGYGRVYVRDFGRENALPPQQNGKLANKVHDHDQGVKKGVKVVHRSKSPVRGGSPRTTSKWHLAARVFTKWVMLFIFLGGIGQTLWNWTMKPSVKDTVGPGNFVSEGQIAELEDLLKTTTKMLQFQVELVDMKYGKEMEGLKKDLEESIEDHATAFYTELQNLKAQTGDIEESLLKLKGSGVLTKDDVLGLLNQVVDKRASEGEGQALSLDDIRAVARRMVEVEIERHAADGLGMVDYAVGTGGGRVVHHSEGYLHANGRKWGLAAVGSFLKTGSPMHPYAGKVLEPSFGEPGQCLPLKGSRVFVDIALRTAIFVNAVTLEHVAKSVAYDRSSAPKEFRIFGWLHQQKEEISEETQQMFLLGEFTYDLERSSVQTFNLPLDSTGKLVNLIKLDVLSNHGSPSHTCIYRLRVHGSEPEVLRPAAVEA